VSKPKWWRPGLTRLRASVLAGAWMIAPPPSLAEGTTEGSEVGGGTASKLTIVSDSACPSREAVARVLATLNAPEAWPTGTVRIRAAGDTLVVDLGVATIGPERSHREIHVTPDCDERATTVALVIATWTGELTSDAASAPVLPRRTGEQQRELGPTQVAPTPPPRSATSSVRAIGAGLLLSSSGGLAPGLSVDFTQTKNPGGLGWQAKLSLPMQRERSAVGGTTRWTRLTADVALNASMTLGRYTLSAAAGVVGAYTLASGQGYPIERSAQALTGGLTASLRAGVSWRRVRVWTQVEAYRFVFPQTILVDSTRGDAMGGAALPSSDLRWAIGLAYPFR
jgi:hypothetical protein